MAYQKKEIEKKPVEVKVPTIAEVEAMAEEVVSKKQPERVVGLDEIAKKTKEDLKKYPLVDIFIPIDESNPNDDIFPINLNGYTIQVPKGKRYKVPEPMYQIWEHSYNSSLKASGMIKAVDARKDAPLAEL